MIQNRKLLYVSIFSLIWAIVTIINKFALNNGVNAIAYTIHVTFVSVIFFLIFLFIKKKNTMFKINASNLIHLISIGISGGVAYILTMYGLQLSTSINYGFLIQSSIVFTVLLSIIFLKEKVTINKIGLILLFLVGAYFITTKGRLIIPRIGDIFILMSALGYSSAVILTKPLVKKVNIYIIAGYRLFFTFLVLLLLIPLINSNIFYVKEPYLVILAGFGSALIAIYLNKTLTLSSTQYVAMMSMITPVAVTALSLSLLKEEINIFQIIGGAIIIVCGITVHKLKI